MKSTETGVLKKSDLLFHTPSTTAKKIYYYPISAGHFYCVENYHLIRKNYKSILVTHIIEGTFTFVLNGKHITAHKGDTVILDCFKPHEYYTNDSFESIWIHFDGPECLKLYNEITENESCPIKTGNSEYIKKLLFGIFNCVKGVQNYSEVGLSLDIYKLLAELSFSINNKRKNAANNEQIINDSKKYISEHLNENLNVKNISEKTHMSSTHFSRIFKQETGYSPYEYVLISRLNKAKEYLQKTDMSVSEISYKVGFNSDTNFIYFFKKNTGMSPNKFRKLKF